VQADYLRAPCGSSPRDRSRSSAAAGRARWFPEYVALRRLFDRLEGPERAPAARASAGGGATPASRATASLIVVQSIALAVSGAAAAARQTARARSRARS
jgi:hypothetical protein